MVQRTKSVSFSADSSSAHMIVESFSNETFSTFLDTSSTLKKNSTLDDDAFLNAMEHETSYIPSMDISQIFEELYTDSIVQNDSSFTVKTVRAPKTYRGRGRVLRATFSSAAAAKAAAFAILTKPMDTMEEFKRKCVNSKSSSNPKKTSSSSSSSSSSSKKSKVKKVAEMFNGKINQLMKRDPTASNYKRLVNESILSEAVTTLTNQLPKPTRKIRIKLPAVRTMSGSPVPSPRRKRPSMENNTATCLVADEVFSKLSVKEKASIFNKIEPTFSQAKINDLMEKNNPTKEKHENVKRLAREMEAKVGFPKQTFSAFALSKKAAITAGQKEEKIAKLDYSDMPVRQEEAVNNISSNNEIDPALNRKCDETDQQKEILANATEASSGDAETIVQKDKVQSDSSQVNISGSLSAVKSAEVPPIPSSKKSRADGQMELTSEDSESGLSSMPVITSDESNRETNFLCKDNASKFEIVKPVKPPRRKKMRRSSIWKKEIPNIDKIDILTTTTDSCDSDCKQSANTVNMQPSFAEATNEEAIDDNNTAETITNSQSGNLNNTIKSDANASMNLRRFESRLKLDTFDDDDDDQGFETASVGVDNSIWRTSSQHNPSIASVSKNSSKLLSPLFIKIAKDLDQSKKCLQLSMPSEDPSASSTPNKQSDLENLPSSGAASRQDECSQWHTIFSPIQAPIKPRRRSIYDSDGRRSSVQMDVIREERRTGDSFGDELFYTCNRPSFIDRQSITTTTTTAEKTSSFWISSGDFTVSTEIFYNTPDRLRLLYEIFSQKSADSRSLNFGIDDMKYSPSDEVAKQEISQRLPRERGCSHYWFSTDDLAVPFNGKCMSQDKIKRLFDFVRAISDGNLRFGIDDFEFSKLNDPVNNCQKFSMESGYSMLIGLNDKSNGLEGRGKYAWPRTTQTSWSMNNRDNLQRDINDGNGEFNRTSEELEGRLTFSSFGSELFELSLVGNEELMMPDNGNAISSSPDFFNAKYENEPLDKLFEDSISSKCRKSNTNIEQHLPDVC